MNIVEQGRMFVNDVHAVSRQYLEEKNTRAMRAALQAHLSMAVEKHLLVEHVVVQVEYREVSPNNIGLTFIARTEHGLELLEAWGLVRRHLAEDVSPRLPTQCHMLNCEEPAEEQDIVDCPFPFCAVHAALWAEGSRAEQIAKSRKP